MIKKLASHLGEYKRAAIITPLLSALEAIMDVLLPLLMSYIIDQGIEKGGIWTPSSSMGLLTFLVAAIALVLGLSAGRFAAKASAGYAGNLRDAMFERIQHYSFTNIDKFSTAGLVTRMTTDVTNVQNAFQMLMRMLRARSGASGLCPHHVGDDQPASHRHLPGGHALSAGVCWAASCCPPPRSSTGCSATTTT